MFSEEYKRDNEIVKPSKEFLDKLKIEMKKEEKKKRKNSLYNVQKVIVIAAILAITFISVESYKKFSSNENDIIKQTQVNKDGNEKEINNPGDLFNNSSWYDSKMSSEEVYKIFINRISSKDDLKELRLSSTNDFTGCKTLDELAVNKLVRLLEGGSLLKDTIDTKENPKYYMASFNNGDIIKFIIYDEKYFECSEFEGSYSINNK